MIDLKLQYKEAKRLAKELMKSGMIGAYLKQLAVVEALQLKLQPIK